MDGGIDVGKVAMSHEEKEHTREGRQVRKPKTRAGGGKLLQSKRDGVAGV